jgi:hypothetical protein
LNHIRKLSSLIGFETNLLNNRHINKALRSNGTSNNWNHTNANLRFWTNGFINITSSSIRIKLNGCAPKTQIIGVQELFSELWRLRLHTTDATHLYIIDATLGDSGTEHSRPVTIEICDFLRASVDQIPGFAANEKQTACNGSGKDPHELRPSGTDSILFDKPRVNFST